MPRSRAIAIVESDRRERLSLVAKLEQEFRVATFDAPAAGSAALLDGAFDVCVARLEWDEAPPGEICRRWRDQGITVPIIGVATELDDERCVEPLNAGADDVVPQSISGRELVARIEAVLRRSRRGKARSTWSEPSFSFSFDEMCVTVGGRRIPLSLGESRLLAALVAEPGLPLPAARLQAALSAGGEMVPLSTVSAQLRSLRKKLGPGRIETRIGFGYAFVPGRAAVP